MIKSVVGSMALVSPSIRTPSPPAAKDMISLPRDNLKHALGTQDAGLSMLL